MYQALYRKWRPRSFDEVVGQGHITDILKKQVAAGHFSHAYLFTGTRGTGKTTCAKLLARAVNCQSPVDGSPCNACPPCLGLLSGEIMDVVEMDAASNNGVDNVRALRDEAVFSPVSVKKRVYIIDEAHMLSASAFNALLKILEEPPGHLMFVLATTELHKIPATILSRCQRYGFRRLDSRLISSELLAIAEKENLRLGADAAELLARLAEGSMRDALSLLDQCSAAANIDEQAVLAAVGLAGGRMVSELLGAVATRDTAAALSIFARLWDAGKAADTLLSELASLVRDVLIFAVTHGEELLSGAYGADVLAGFSKKLGAAELLRELASIQSALAEIKTGAGPRTAAELCIIGLCEPELSDSSASLLARIERLEAGAAACPPARGMTAPEKTEAGKAETGKAEAGKAEAGKAEAEPVCGRPSEADEIDTPPDEKIPEAPQTGADGLAGGFWQALQSALEGKLKIGVYNLLCDPAQVEGVLSDDTLLIRASGFALKMLNSPETAEKLGAAAAALAGRAVRLRFEELKRKREPETNKLDELMKYGNVKQID